MYHTENDTHMELALSESETSAVDTKSDRSWYQFCAVVEAILGHDLDGSEEDLPEHQITNVGFSIDGALSAWAEGCNPASYARLIQRRPEYQAAKARGEHQYAIDRREQELKLFRDERSLRVKFEQ